MTILNDGAAEAAGPEEPDWELLLPPPEKEDASFNSLMARVAAEREWTRITAAMRAADTLGPANAHTIQRLVLAYVRYDHAIGQVTRLGAVQVAPNGVQMLGIWHTVAKQASDEAVTLEAELGLTPRRRAAAGKLKGKKPQGRAIDGFLRPQAGAPAPGKAGARPRPTSRH
jgi:P27 family predicted phage terminase small subunit